jgi:hypothetical protein
MSTCVIMQPTAFPWAGYFNLMAQADVFVFLDDVQLAPRSWQTRNQIIINGSKRWISFDIKNAGSRQMINEALIFDLDRWKKKNIKTISQAYARHPHAEAIREIVDLLDSFKSSSLSAFNEGLIEFIANRLDIAAPRLKSSQIKSAGQRGDRIISICEAVMASEYLSPIGSKDYLEIDRFTQKTTISLRFQDYLPGIYRQHGLDSFESHLSIIDVIANLGWDLTKEYIRGSRNESVLFN